MKKPFVKAMTPLVWFRKFSHLGQKVVIMMVLLSLLVVHRVDGFTATTTPLLQPRFGTRLFQSTKTPSSSSKTNVVFSKVVRPAPNQQPIEFLPQLVEYLQDKFRLPANLPMVYESSAAEKSDKAVISFYSPLSSSADETRLSIEVVGIHTPGDGDNDKSTIPDMAMVAVHKLSAASMAAPMMMSLFADSEKKILRALDRGLEQLSAGKVTGLTPGVIVEEESSNDWQSVSWQDVEGEHDRNDNSDDGVIDTASVAVDSEMTMENATSEFAVEAAKRAAAKRGKPVDFAVEAAKKAVARKQSGGDFAVEAAKKMAKRTKGEAKATPRKKKAQPTEVAATEASTRMPSSDRPTLGGPSWSISSPKKRKEQQKKKQKKEVTKQQLESVEVSEVIQDTKTTEVITAKSSSLNAVLDAEIVPEKKKPVIIDSDRKLNVNVIDDKDVNPTELPFAPIDPADMQAKEGDTKEVQLAKEAVRVMEEIAGQSQDMTPEQLLKDVLKFGEEQKKEEEVGSGFVSGAFEKAKELLREQKQQRQERQFKEVNAKSIGDIKLDILDPDADSVTAEETPEEELKRLFRAGEQLAENRMDLSKAAEAEERRLTEKQDEQVDELLAKEKTISTHARTLDEELAELEVRINRNPDEEMDGPMKNPLFDVMSGPEVYNPNVDPETAVNWPGALPGTKTVRLPKELDEAVKQAKFAAEVVMKLREEEAKDPETGEETINYFAGDRVLSHAEVLNLKAVVHEGVKLGLLSDPVEFLKEQSRLQMLIDELWQQPEERFKEIAENYKDLLLSDNLVDLMKIRLTEMADRDVDALRKGDEDNQEFKQRHERERKILGQLVIYAQLLLKEARALGAELEAQQIEVIRSICKVAMDPSFVTEEETARALTDAVRDMRPMFDDAFVAYIKFAVAEEEGRLARAGILDDPEHNQWLMVLQIVQQGVYAEIAKGINRYIEHIWYVLRMETRDQRRYLLSELIDAMPTLDVRPFVQVVENIVGSLGDAVNGEADPMVLGEMTNKLLQLHRDVEELLPPDRINEMAKDADEWAAKQKQRLLEMRNVTKKRLKESRETEHLADAILKRAGEVERFE